MSYTLTEEQQKEVLRRYASVKCAFDSLKNIPSNRNNCIIMMQPNQLYCTIVSWILDEGRHINFHDCKGLETHKMASYFAYWFVRMKPIQTLSASGVSDSRLVLANEIFVLYYICGMLGIECSKVMSGEFYEDFVYMLRYRKFTAESIFPIIRLLEMSVKNIGLSSY